MRWNTDSCQLATKSVAKSRLSKEDLDEFRKRVDLLNQQQRAVNNTEIANEFWMKLKIRKLGLDETKNYKIMRDTGNIVVIETKDNFEVDGDKGDKEVS